MFPDLTQFYMLIYGGYGYSYSDGCAAYLGLAAGATQRGNPPYTIANFTMMYPKFLGPVTSTAAVLNGTTLVSGIPSSFGFQPSNLVVGTGIPDGTVITGVTTTPIDATGDLLAGQYVILNVSSTAGMIVGQPIAGPGIGGCATIAAVGANSITLSQSPTADGVGVGLMVTSSTITLSNAATQSGSVTLAVYSAPPVAPAVIQLFINLANASLMSSRWREAWPLAMGLYVAHFLTLFVQSDGLATSTPGQIVTSGMQVGILTSQSADGVSMGSQPVTGLASWGAWTTTTYGTQLATIARAGGAGMVYFRG